MTDTPQTLLLRRLGKPHAATPAANPLTTSRAVRLALTRAADDSVGLKVTVQSVGETVHPLDDMLSELTADLMLVQLLRDGVLTGVIALDMDLRAAVLEMQTVGSLLTSPAEPRPATGTDRALCDPLVQGFLAAFPQAMAETALAGWADGVHHGDGINSTRAAGLALADGTYRVVRMTIDLGVADRQGQLIIALPVVEPPDVPVATPPMAQGAWRGMLQDNIYDAPACLSVLLHRFSVPLATAQAWQIGSLLPLPGCTAHSVRRLVAG